MSRGDTKVFLGNLPPECRVRDIEGFFDGLLSGFGDGSSDSENGDFVNVDFSRRQMGSAYMCAKREGAMCECDGIVVYGRKYYNRQSLDFSGLVSGYYSDYTMREVNGQIRCNDRNMGSIEEDYWKTCWCVPS